MSQFSDFIESHQITTDRIAAESRAAERLDADDRAKYVQRADARREKKSYADLGAEKPGGLRRGVSERTLKLALEGAPITRVNRKKIARAVNGLLAGKEEVTVQKLFGDSASLNLLKKRKKQKKEGED